MSTALPAICVVTVCRNAIDSLRVTHASVANQRYAALRYLVVDGGSTDGTVAFLKAANGRVDHWVSEPDEGIYHAMNKAIGLCARESWVIFLNAGDQFADADVLNRVSKTLNDGIDLVFGGVSIQDGRGGIRTFPASLSGARKMPGCHQSMLASTRLLRLLQFNTRYKVGADFDFYLRSVRCGARIQLYGGIISEVAPEGFSAKNEDILQQDYAQSIRTQYGTFRAVVWLACRRLRLGLRKLFR